MKNKELIIINEITSKIYTIRECQVMLDEDLAILYGVETKRLNEQVKRNIERFPSEFMFQLNKDEMERLQSLSVSAHEIDSLRSRNATLENGRGKHRKYMPYVFTEQGVAMLSAVLRSDTAVKTSIQIMNAFVAMRRFLTENGMLFSRLDSIEKRQIEYEIKTDNRFDTVFKAIEEREITPQKGIFFDGHVYDAHKFVSDIIKDAKKSIILIDNYIDDTVLTQLAKKKKNATVTIFTRKISKQLTLDAERFNEQYPTLKIKTLNKSHDRFIIIDESIVYHIGASLKDLGKKWFAFSRFETEALELLDKLRGEGE